MGVVDQNVDTVGISLDRRDQLRRPGDVASKMGVAAAALFDQSRQMPCRALGPRQTDNIVARVGEGFGDAGTETFGGSGQEQGAPAGGRHQIQRRMLAMIAIWASQPAVNVSVRAAGIPAE